MFKLTCKKCIIFHHLSIENESLYSGCSIQENVTLIYSINNLET